MRYRFGRSIRLTRKPVGPALIIAAVAAAILAPSASQNLPTHTLVSRASAYVAEYQKLLASVVADEDYTQEILEQEPVDRSMPRKRRLTSEVFFLFEPAAGQWMAIRDTQLVDGAAVPNRVDVRGLFDTLTTAEVGHRYSYLNARWNIGRTLRNFNEPTLALLLFEASRAEQVKFDRKSVTQTADGTLVTLAFKERDRPTLIVDRSGRPVHSSGEVLMELDGRIRRTVFRVEADSVKVELTTEYAPNEKLGMWVPIVFRERYERDRRRERELIVAQAIYGNYRRFGVETRIK